MELLKGRETNLTDEIRKQILDAIPKVYALPQVAGMCKVLPDTLRKWLRRGKTELKENKDSIFVDFFLDYYQRRAEVAHELNRNLKWYFKQNSWLLERTYKKDYGPNDDQRKFFDLMAKKLAKLGIDFGDFESFMEDMELENESS